MSDMYIVIKISIQEYGGNTLISSDLKDIVELGAL
jgi:hypothetical protein